MPKWVVLADDRTGALEVAGALADRVGPVPVVAWSRMGTAVPALPDLLAVPALPAGSVAVVVDLGSRHLAAAAAAQRAAAWSRAPAQRRLHKVDSTLRGRWADELVAVQRTSGDRVLLVPALPGLGRTCAGGVVHVDGRRLQFDDPRDGPVEARPAHGLTLAGAPAVAELATAADVAAWADDGSAPVFAVCDASTDDDLAAIAAAWRTTTGIVLAGTSASVAAGLGGRQVAERSLGGDCGSRGRPPDRPVVVAVGSLHPMAREQVRRLRGAAVPGVDVVTTAPVGGPVGEIAAGRAAAGLAAEVRRRLATDGAATVVLVGGDTAAAVLGDDVQVAGGTVAPGIPWARRVDGGGPLVITKAGGFGDPDTLVDLLAGRLGAAAR